MVRTKARRPAPRRTTLADQLREAVRASGRNDHDLATEAGVDPTSFGRFMKSDRNWTLDTAERVAAVLGLALAAKARHARPAPK